MHPGHSVEGSALSTALRDGSIVPYFQPIVDLEDEAVVGFEVLARWIDPVVGVIPPSEFIAEAERTGLLDDMLAALMRHAFMASHEWPDTLFLAFNVSPAQLHRHDLPDRIARLAADHGFARDRIHLEITETAIHEDADHAEAMLRRLIAMGCTISMDDFGTGYSSLTWLSRLPFRKLKIDGSFVQAMLRHREDRKIVSAVVGLGQSLDITVIAEGIETAEQEEMLRRMGCPLGQGYLFARPMSADSVSAFLSGKRQGGHQRVASMSLEQRAHQISSLYRSTNISIGFLDTQYVIRDASETFTRRIGRTEMEIVGRKLQDMIPPEIDKTELLKSFSSRGEAYPIVEVILPSGETDIIIIHQVRDEASELLGYSILAIDITERKRALSALRESEENYRIAAMLNPHMSWQMNTAGDIISIHDPAGVIGLAFDNLVGKRWLDGVMPADRSRAHDELLHSLDKGGVRDVELRYLHPSLGYRWYRIYMAPRRAPDGTILRWYGISEDIHERKLTEFALHEEKEQFRFVVERSPHMFWIMSATGATTFSSPLWYEQTGIPQESASHEAFLNLIHPDYRVHVLDRWSKCFAEGSVFDFDYPVKLADGAYHWMRCWGEQRRSSDGAVIGWYGTISKLTAPRRLPAGNEDRPTSSA